MARHSLQDERKINGATLGITKIKGSQHGKCRRYGVAAFDAMPFKRY